MPRQLIRLRGVATARDRLINPENRSYQGSRATRLAVPTITPGTALHEAPSARQQLRPHNESEDIAPCTLQARVRIPEQACRACSTASCPIPASCARCTRSNPEQSRSRAEKLYRRRSPCCCNLLLRHISLGLESHAPQNAGDVPIPDDYLPCSAIWTRA